MAIYAINRPYLWNSNPCLKAWPLLSSPAAAGIRCNIPACPPCAGVHPRLKNEEEKGPSQDRKKSGRSCDGRLICKRSNEADDAIETHPQHNFYS
jgi:hypothetical protein